MSENKIYSSKELDRVTYEDYLNLKQTKEFTSKTRSTSRQI